MSDFQIKENFSSGFVSFVGRPNVGKSSLTNALAGEKIAITSNKPQTTRKAIRVIINEEDGQIILVDTPGIHRPRTLLGERLNALVEDTLEGVDVIGYCIPANEDIGPGDRYINEQLDDYKHSKKIAIVTKIDLVSRDQVVNQLALVNELREWDAVIPVSESNPVQLEELKKVLIELLPESMPLYDSHTLTEETEEDRIEELVREAIIEDVHDELPHSLAITIEDQELDDDDVLNIYINIFVERDSQKGIIIGHKGKSLTRIKRRARKQIEELTGGKVRIHLHVKVLKDWQKNSKFLNKLGF